MSSIDTVTASFATSLALADGGKASDLGKIRGGPVRRSSQSFLLAKPLTRRVVDPEAFKSHFARAWVVQRNFRIQERGDLFLVSFESKKDRTKILKGGAWCFDCAPVCLEVYDGITPMTDVPMSHVRMWVIVSLIPPRCFVCNMITHVGEKCDGTHTVLGTSRGINCSAQPKPGYAFSTKPTIGVAINPAPVHSSSLVVKRKPVVRRLGSGNKASRSTKKTKAPLCITYPVVAKVAG
ncbi:hypothetical protein ACLB2K_042019 [Fragaria x ananassa]